MIDLSLPRIAAAILVMAIGSALQATVGVGLALLAAPLLALLDVRFVPGPMLLASVIVAVATATHERDAIDGRKLWLALTGLAAGTILGAATLEVTVAADLHKIFGALVLLAIAISVLGFKVEPVPHSLLLGGAASGLMGTMVGIHGPPISLVLQNAKPEFARAMLGAFFAVAYVGAVLALTVAGLFGVQQCRLSLVLVPGAILGLLAAPLVRGRLDRRRLRWAILLISGVSGTSLLLR
jgi:uncharacterized membrane protein YfcA